MNGLNHRTYPICLKRASNDELHREIRNCRKAIDAGLDPAGISRDKVLHCKAEFEIRETHIREAA